MQWAAKKKAFFLLFSEQQISVFDPVETAEEVAEEPAENCREDEADEDEAEPVHAGDGVLGSCSYICYPS